MLAIALSLAAATLQDKPGDDPDRHTAAVLDQADRAVASGHPQQGIDLVAPLIAGYERQYRTERRQIYCAMSPTETVYYMGLAAAAKHSAEAIDANYCRALYLRGFALFDLNKIADARASYARAVELAPMHAHFLVELGQTYRVTKEWDKMLARCNDAATATALTPEEDRPREQGFAWRCQGYALTEQGEWDKAEARYRDCLRVDPNDDKAKHELQYIAEQRARPRV